MKLELERSESVVSDFMNMIEKEAKKLSHNGEAELLISRDILEKTIAEEILFMEIEKGKHSVRESRTHTKSDFQRRYDLV